MHYKSFIKFFKSSIKKIIDYFREGLRNKTYVLDHSESCDMHFGGKKLLLYTKKMFLPYGGGSDRSFNYDAFLRLPLLCLYFYCSLKKGIYFVWQKKKYQNGK